MKLFRAIKKANEERDIETLMSLYHDDFEFVRHQSGTTLKKSPAIKKLCTDAFMKMMIFWWNTQ
jgi:ketosteroid isomerase-like protein